MFAGCCEANGSLGESLMRYFVFCFDFYTKCCSNEYMRGFGRAAFNRLPMSHLRLVCLHIMVVGRPATDKFVTMVAIAGTEPAIFKHNSIN